MVQIAGKYELASSEGIVEYLHVLGGDDHAEAVKAFTSGHPTFEISGSGDQWEITVSNQGKSSSVKFTLGTPYDEPLPHGTVFKSKTTRTGDTFTTVTEIPDGNQAIRAYEFTDAGINVHLSDIKRGAKATRFYKRL